MAKNFPARVQTYGFRLTPLQYPIMRDIVLHGLKFGLESLEKFNNGPVRNLHRRGLIQVIDKGHGPYLVATPAGARAFEFYHRGVIAKRKVSNDITDYVRVMLRLKKARVA